MKTCMLFFGAFMCASLAFAQAEKPPRVNEDPETPTERVHKVADVGNKASSRRLVGPAAKNPLAAGRAGRDSAAPPAVAPPVPFRLTGPAYKNRKPDTSEAPQRSVRKTAVTGPRYKNRTAKPGRKVVGFFRRHYPR